MEELILYAGVFIGAAIPMLEVWIVTNDGWPAVTISGLTSYLSQDERFSVAVLF